MCRVNGMRYNVLEQGRMEWNVAVLNIMVSSKQNGVEWDGKGQDGMEQDEM